MVQARDGEQRRDGGFVARHATIAQDEDVDLILLDQAPRFFAELLHRLGDALGTAGGAEQQRERPDLQTGQRQAPDLGELFVREHRRLELDATAVGRSRLEQVAHGAEPDVRRGDDLLADAVDGRVRDLREELLEVVVEQARTLRQHRERRVVAHRSHGLDAVAGHRRHQDAKVLEGIAEGDLARAQQLGLRRRQLRRRRQFFEVDEMLAQPLGVGPFLHHAALDLLVVDDAPLLGVDHEHVAGLQAALADDIGGRDVEHARLGGGDHHTVLGDPVAPRPQAVTIEHGAHAHTVGEADRGGTVPGLHQARVELVERAAGGIHGLMLRPRLRDHHHHRVRERTAGEHHQFQHVVEHRRVAAVDVDDGRDLRDVITEERRLELRLAGAHPVDVAAQRVDLAVVRDVAIGVGAVPARERVGAEARMHERDGGLEARIAQVGEILVELHRQQHPLVDQRLVGQACDIPGLGAAQRRDTDLVVGTLADDIELALEGLGIRRVSAALDEHLTHERFARACRLAEHRVVGGYRAATEIDLPLGLNDACEGLLEPAPLRRVARHEDESAGVLAGLRERDVCLLGSGLQEAVRHLHQHTRAVAGVDLAATGASVVEVLQDLDRVAQDLVGLTALDVHHEADAAGIALELGIVEALLAGAGGADRGPTDGGIIHMCCSQIPARTITTGWGRRKGVRPH